MDKASTCLSRGLALDHHCCPEHLSLLLKGMQQGAAIIQLLGVLLTVQCCTEYAQVLRMLGNGRLEATCIDGNKRLCHIRGKMRKKVWVNTVRFSVPY